MKHYLIQITVDKTDEKVLSGHEFGIASQVPYMPWAKLHYTDYLWEKDQASARYRGKNILSRNAT